MGKMEAARKASLIASPIEKSNLSRCIRVWADYSALHQELPVRRQGAPAKIVSFIADEIMLMSFEYCFVGCLEIHAQQKRLLSVSAISTYSCLSLREQHLIG